VLSFGLAPSTGLKKGVVVDMDATAGAINDAVSRACESVGVSPDSVYIGVAGGHIECTDSYGAIGIKGRQVTKWDMDSVLEAASTVYVPLDREVLHVMPTEYIVDGQGGIVQPTGMSGVRLESNVSVITVSHSAVENLAKCCERSGLNVADTVFEPLAAYRAVARPHETESGIAVIDIGGGTSDVAVFNGGVLNHASVLPVGGNHLTNDIAIGLKLSMKEAERVKREFGYAVAEVAVSEEMLVETMDGRERSVCRGYLGEIIMPRCEEIFGLIRENIAGSSLSSVPTCVVLTGGTSLLEGIDRVAEAVLGMPVRVGLPENARAVGNEDVLGSPAFATSVGLMLYGIEADTGICGEMIEGALGRFRRWFKDLSEVRKWGFGWR
jgi:cell division protein FtsA